jgi:hypothetical protein
MHEHHSRSLSPARVALLLATLLAVILACHSTRTGSGDSTAGSEDRGPATEIPEAVRAMADGAEIAPFMRWSVTGVRLYCLSFAVPDETTARVVGVEDGTGKLLTGAELLRRGGMVPPEELARRVYGALLGQAFREPLRPDEERSQFASEGEWSLVQPPHEDGGTLVFFSTEGDMSPSLVEHRLDLATYTLTTRSARQILLERGQPDAATDTAAPAALRYGKYFTADGAPEPLACTADADCTTGTILGERGCCTANPPALLPMTNAYAAWAGAHRASAACSAAACPPPPAATIPECPTEPPPDCCFRAECGGEWSAETCPCCDFHVRCIDGWCRNACTRDWQAQVPAAPSP